MKYNVDALYCDPNAYIKRNKEKPCTPIKRVVFSEPYDCLPNHYIDYGFKKKNCECVKCKKDVIHQEKDNKCNQKKCSKNDVGFFGGLTNILPLLLKGNGGGFSNILSLFNSSNNLGVSIENLLGKSEGKNILSNMIGDGNLLNGLLSLFGGKGKDKTENKNEIITTDYEIKNYTRV